MEAITTSNKKLHGFLTVSPPAQSRRANLGSARQLRELAAETERLERLKQVEDVGIAGRVVERGSRVGSYRFSMVVSKSRSEHIVFKGWPLYRLFG